MIFQIPFLLQYRVHSHSICVHLQLNCVHLCTHPLGNKALLCSVTIEKVIPAFRGTYTEDKYPYDYTREAIDNFKNLKKLTEGC